MRQDRAMSMQDIVRLAEVDERRLSSLRRLLETTVQTSSYTKVAH